VNKGDRVTGKFIADEKAIWQVKPDSEFGARRISLPKKLPGGLSPIDSRQGVGRVDQRLRLDHREVASETC
jgi:hypothetical protein